jgi:hypothetical protein
VDKCGGELIMKYQSLEKKKFDPFGLEPSSSESSAENADIDTIPLSQATPEQLREIIRRREATKEEGAVEPTYITGPN